MYASCDHTPPTKLQYMIVLLAYTEAMVVYLDHILFKSYDHTPLHTPIWELDDKARPSIVH